MKGQKKKKEAREKARLRACARARLRLAVRFAHGVPEKKAKLNQGFSGRIFTHKNRKPPVQPGGGFLLIFLEHLLACLHQTETDRFQFVQILLICQPFNVR